MGCKLPDAALPCAFSCTTSFTQPCRVERSHDQTSPWQSFLAFLPGTNVYPATIFTDAPISLLQLALADLSHSMLSMPSPMQQQPALRQAQQAQQAQARQQLLLSVEGLTVQLPGGEAAVQDLWVGVARGAHLLIVGRSGCGKSTLLRALAGLYPVAAGAAVFACGRSSGGGTGGVGGGSRSGFQRERDQRAVGPEGGALVGGGEGSGGLGMASGVMFLPQRPMAAPGRRLWQQLVYPAAARPPTHTLSALAAAVGLDGVASRHAAGFDAGKSEMWARPDMHALPVHAMICMLCLCTACPLPAAFLPASGSSCNSHPS
jgi:hypothetical protein